MRKTVFFIVNNMPLQTVVMVFLQKYYIASSFFAKAICLKSSANTHIFSKNEVKNVIYLQDSDGFSVLKNIYSTEVRN